MDCNKEEAVRARDLAERKLKDNDYTCAHKVALKARQLYPDLENLNQLVAVCEVHCAAGIKVNGQTDWYGILQVGTTADDQLIRKAYRKLALLLHPDKNKYPGAEAAFKLIGEANTILSDKRKRSEHDLNRKNFVKRAPPPAARAHRGTAGNAAFSGPNSNSNQAAANQPFWTMCHSCVTRYQYDRSVLNKTIRCQNCLKPFVAFEISIQAMPSGTSCGVNPKPSFSFNPSNGPSSAPPSRSFGGPNSQGCPANGNNSNASTANGQKFERVNIGNVQQNGGPMPRPEVGTRPAPAQANTTKVPPVNSNKRKRKALEDEEEESDSSDTSDSEDEVILEQKMHPNGTNDPPRRSSRKKQNVSYNEKADCDIDLDDYDDIDNSDEDEEDDDFLAGHKKKQPGNESNETDDIPNQKEEEADPSSGQFMYQEAEFFQFDKLRDQTKFEVGQVWAVYDDSDGMPRFYARIKSVNTSPMFQMQYVWFESVPDQSTLAWSDAGLPVATGTFKLGQTQLADGLLIFSHTILCEKVKRNIFTIYPKKGEIWAMFKDWDGSWVSKSEKKRDFKYEMVQVVSDFTDSTGFVVMPLVKINGFISLFIQSREATPVVIPRSEVLRFSHSVPKYCTTGNERDGVPEGAFELDPASLPADLENAFSSIDLDPKPKQKPSTNSSSVHKEEKKEGRENHVRVQEGYEEGISMSKSHDYQSYLFSSDRSIEKCKRGQIWALYCDIDELPKFYALVEGINVEKAKVQIRWLETCAEGVVGEEKSWIDKGLPLGCGTFSCGGRDFTDIRAFSHMMVDENVIGKSILYKIIPAKSEVWAVYSNWTTGWTKEHITDKCQYDLVHVSEVTSIGITVSILAKVAGYRAVFGLDAERKTMMIPRGELIKFSHRIPAHQLTHEAGGALRGCWELDPESLPKSLVSEEF